MRIIGGKYKVKLIDTDGNVGFKSGKHINVRKQYNCTGKYKEIPVETLWEEVRDIYIILR